MEPLRFVHAADLHFDSPVTGLISRNEVVGARVREAGYQALENLFQLCLNEEVDFLLVAGDVYDGSIRSPQAQLRFRDGLARLSDAGIQGFAVHGNHDPLNGRFSSIEWPEGAEFFGPEPEWKLAFRGGEPIAQIQGVSYPRRDVTENLAARFSAPPDSGMFAIGLLHCNVGSDPAHPNYAPCSVNDLKTAGIDYWALGHIHKREIVYQDQFMTVVYPGNTQARDAGEPGARGCYVVDVNGDGRVELEFRSLDAVRWDLRELPVEGMVGVDRLRDEILNTLDDARDAGDGRDVVCRIRLTGRGPVHRDLAYPSELQGLAELIQGDLPMASPWVWLDRLTDETKPEIDLDARAAQDDFLGAVLKRAQATSPDDFRVALKEAYSGRRDAPAELSDAEIELLSDEARWYLADLLDPADAGGQST